MCKRSPLGDRNRKLPARGCTAQLREHLCKAIACASVGPKPGFLQDKLAALLHHWNCIISNKEPGPSAVKSLALASEPFQYGDGCLPARPALGLFVGFVYYFFFGCLFIIVASSCHTGRLEDNFWGSLLSFHLVEVGSLGNSTMWLVYSRLTGAQALRRVP